MPLVGFLANRSSGESAHLIAAFRRGLSETGHVEGKNVQIASALQRGNLPGSRRWPRTWCHAITVAGLTSIIASMRGQIR